MEKFRSTVLGAGGYTGFATVYELARRNNVERINLFDIKWTADEGGWDAMHHDMNRFEALLGPDLYKKLLFFDKERDDLWTTADVVLSCASHAANVELTKKAIRFGVPHCDLGGCPQVVAEQEKLARLSTTPVVPDCGLSPGSANVLAAHLNKKFGSACIGVYCGVNPVPPPDPKENPLRYKIVYSAEGVASGYCGKSFAIEDGEIVSTPAIAYVDPFDRDFEAIPTSHNSRYVAEYLQSLGVEEYYYRTLRYQGHCRRLWADGWRFDSDPHEFAQYLLSQPGTAFDREKDRDRAVLVVKALDGKGPTFKYDIPFDARTKFTALEIGTALGIAIVAEYLALGNRPRKPFATPEQFVDTNWYIEQFGKRLRQYR